MINIAFVINSIETNSAGTEKQLLAVLCNLDRLKFNPHLISLRPSSWLAKADLNCEVTILNIPKLVAMNAWAGIRRYRHFLKEKEFDIVHAHYFDSVMLTMRAAANLPIKVITSRRGFVSSEKPQLAKRLLLRRMAGQYDGIICNSKALADETSRIEGIKRNLISVIYNGIDTNRLASVKPVERPGRSGQFDLTKNDIHIVTVANLRPVKNIELLIKAAEQLTEKYHNLFFTVIGEGDQHAFLLTMIKELNLNERFQLTGALSNPETILASADIAVLPSRSESLSNALIEYSALGLPAVASDVGGNGEVIENEKSGLLFQSDNLESLIEKLSRLIENPDLRVKMGRTGKKRAANLFSIERCLDEYSNYYSIMTGRES